jgi:ATP-dependent helicase IRC3
MIELPESRWPNQKRAFAGVLDGRSRGVRRLCVTSPTGTGKSLCMFDLLRWAKSESMTAVLYTNRRMLFEQIAGNLDREGIDFGRRASGHDEALLREIQLAMVQTEIRKVATEQRDLHPADLVIVDEYHQFCSDKSQAILDSHVNDGALLVGYTATPIDICGIDELIIAGKPSECRAIGALVGPDTYAPDEPDLRHIKKYKVGEDPTQAENHKAIMRPGVFGRVINAWKKHNPHGKPTILFGPDVRGSLFFAQEFCKAGIPAAHIDGEEVWIDGEFLSSNQDNRDFIKELMLNGQIKVVCNRFVMREGIDWPFVECLIFATVFGALTSFLQAGGRGLRAYPGKTKCCILDHGGNWHRGFGSLAEDRNWELGLSNHRIVAQKQEEYREKKTPEPICCPECGKVRNTGKKCPFCGCELHKSARTVVQVNGDLKRVNGEVHKPRRVKLEKDTAQKWSRMYYRAKSVKWNATFKQAEAMFFREEHYWPPHNLPLMPKEPGDWFRRVANVPHENLIQQPVKAEQQRSFV